MCATSLTEDDVIAYVRGICFKTGPPGRIGVESEWLITDPDHPYEHVPLPRIQAAVAAADPLPAGSAISYEPGGQLELSSLPYDGVSACYAAARADLTHLEHRLARTGLRLSGLGLDPVRPPVRQVDGPRYAAMESFLSTHGDAGAEMMCSTAAVQVCVDIGRTPDDAQRRWYLAHALGPVLVAAFANSPLRAGRLTGWRSTRQAVWASLDPCRTRPPTGHDAAEAWARYALDAEVMVVRRDGRPWLVDPGMTFRDWLHADARERPSVDDLAYHLSTLFPPVRPRGCLELRMVDAQRTAYWPVPLAVIAALFDDAVAADIARSATEPVVGRWREAARGALADPELARCARACFTAAVEALPRLGAGSELVALVAEFADRYVERARCPADEILSRPEEVLT